MTTALKTHRNHLNDTDECFILKQIVYNTIPVTYSVIVPIYNQERIIQKNIESILKYTGGSFELLIILDFCNDATESILLQFFDSFKNTNPLFYGVTIFKQPNSPIFEASCDNIGFVHSIGKYCLEIQADMEMVMPNYNLYLSKPFTLLDNVFAVSGRCAHNMFREGGIGKMGTKCVQSIKELNVSSDIFYVYETCNRGPLLFDKKKLEELNFLDEKNYHLDNSEHDIILRANLTKNYISGYVPIDFLSPLADGSTRKWNPCMITMRYKQLRIAQHKIKGEKGYQQGETITKYKSLWNPIPETQYEIGTCTPIL